MVGVEVHFLRALGLEVLVDMVIALVVNVIDTLMIDMMEDVMGIGIVLIAEITNMAVVIAMLVTGIHGSLPLLNYCFGAFALVCKTT